MVAAAVPLADLPLPDGLYEVAVGRLVEAGLVAWAQDAGRWLKCGDLVPARDRRRCQDAWTLILRRPAGCPLIDVACLLADVDELAIWAWLWRRAVAAAGLG